MRSRDFFPKTGYFSSTKITSANEGFQTDFMFSMDMRFLCSLSFQVSPVDFVKSAFSSRKGAFATNPVSPRSKKMRLFDSWYHQSDKIKNAPLTRLFSIFCKNVFFIKSKGAFSLNWVPALYHGGKGAFFSKSMDFQLSLEKKLRP